MVLKIDFKMILKDKIDIDNEESLKFFFDISNASPGIALRLHEAISQRDYTLVQGIVIFTSMLIVSLNLFVDILIAYLDPRIDY